MARLRYTPSLEPRKECMQIRTLHYKYMPTLLQLARPSLGVPSIVLQEAYATQDDNK